MNLKETNSLYYNPYSRDKSTNDIKILEQNTNLKRKNDYQAKKTLSLNILLKQCGDFLNTIFNLRKTETVVDLINSDNFHGTRLLQPS